MKILIVYQYFLSRSSGGVSRFNRLARLFAQDGAECTVICSRYTQHGEPVGPEAPLPENGVLRIRRIFSARGKSGGMFSRLLSYCSFGVRSFFAALREPRTDVILISSPPLSLALTAILLKRVLRLPLVLDLRDLWPENAIDLRLLRSRPLIRLSRMLERHAYRVADLIAVVTPAYRTYLKGCGIPDEKICCFPNSSDQCLVQPEKSPEQIRRERHAEGKYIVGYFGNHGYAANLSQILDVAELLKSEPDILFLFAGNGFDRDNLILSARQRGLTNVLFLPNQPLKQACELIRACDCCLASLLRAHCMTLVYPSKIFEYMFFSKPILHTVDGICRDMIRQAGCGFYCEPEQPRQLAEKIRWLYRHPEEAAHMGKSGHDFAEIHFNSEKIAREYLDKITSLAESFHQNGKE